MLTVQVAGWIAFILGAAGFVWVFVEEAWKYLRRVIRVSRFAASEEGPSLGARGTPSARNAVTAGTYTVGRPLEDVTARIPPVVLPLTIKVPRAQY